jgi:competence protein ComEA
MLKHFKSFLFTVLLVLSPMLMAEPVDINSATADELSKALSGVGPGKAKAIVEYREKNGPFKSADELKKVKGIGKATLEKNRAVINVGGSAGAAPAVAAPATTQPAAAPVAPAPAAQ